MALPIGRIDWSVTDWISAMLNDELDIPQSIKNYGQGGVKAETSIIDEKEYKQKLKEVARLAISDACTGSNPRQPSQEDMEKLLLAVYNDEDIDF